MNCSGGETFMNNTPFKLVVLFQALLSIVAIVVNPFVLKTIYSRMYFHRNIRMLLGLGLLANMVHSIFYAVLQGTHSYLMYTASNGCEVLVSPTFCNVLRIPPYWAIMCFGVIVNVMVIERLLATVKLRSYEDISSLLGVSLCAASVCAGVFIGTFTAKGPVAKEYVPYCTLLNADNARNISWWAVLAIVVELSVVTLFVGVIHYNKKMEKNLRYNVKVRFQIRENLAVCRTLTYWLSFYFATLVFMTGSTVLIPRMLNYEVESMHARTILAANNIMPLFCVISPIALKMIYRREQTKRRTGIKVMSKAVTTEQYHLAYTAGWNK